MAGLRLRCTEDQMCTVCGSEGTLVEERGQIVCTQCCAILAERLVGETLEHANTHNAPLDEHLKTRFMLVGGKIREVVVKNKWCQDIKHDLTVMAGDKDIAMGEDIIKCAIGLVDAVENLKTTRVTAAGAREVRMFRCVQQSTKACIKWALIQLAHDHCHVYNTLDADVCDVMRTNAMTKTLRGFLDIEPYCPSDSNLVAMHIRGELAAALRQESTTPVDRRTLTKHVNERQGKVMGMWESLQKAQLNGMRYKVKCDPSMLLRVYEARVKKTRPSASKKSTKELIKCLTQVGFDWETLV